MRKRNNWFLHPRLVAVFYIVFIEWCENKVKLKKKTRSHIEHMHSGTKLYKGMMSEYKNYKNRHRKHREGSSEKKTHPRAYKRNAWRCISRQLSLRYEREIKFPLLFVFVRVENSDYQGEYGALYIPSPLSHKQIRTHTYVSHASTICRARGNYNDDRFSRAIYSHADDPIYHCQQFCVMPIHHHHRWHREKLVCVCYFAARQCLYIYR